MIALTGGIGSGKSTVARYLAELGAHVIDYDQIAKDIVAPGEPALTDIEARFSEAVIDPETGELRRAELAKIVFNDPQALKDLNHITHPRINERAAEIQQEIMASDPGAVIVRDVPLLTPTSEAAQGVDLIVAVSVDTEIRVQRLKEIRGMDEADARRRIANQKTDEERAAFADVVLENNGTPAELKAQVDDLWKRHIGGETH